MRIERLRNKANSLPTVPGVYIMKDSDGNVIYVGKSISVHGANTLSHQTSSIWLSAP